MYDYAVWWILMGFLLVAELFTGSLYLLMLAISAAIGGVCAYLELDVLNQLLIASVAGVCSLVSCYLIRRNIKKSKEGDITNHLDIGAFVMVDEWLQDGTTQVKHRGANWTAVCIESNKVIGLHQVTAINGTRLVIKPTAL